MVANLVQFVSAALALLKGVARNPGLEAQWVLALVYSVFAAGFGLVMYRTPKLNDSNDL